MTSPTAGPLPLVASPRPSLGALTATFARIGLLSFGGAAGQIAMMHRVIVEEKRWIDERRYLQALNYCMLLPGPEAQQLATYIGWMLHGVRGGLVAGLLFIVPGALIMLALSFIYVLGTGSTLLQGLFLGIKAAVLAIVAQAVIRIARRGLGTPLLRGLAIAAFALMTFTSLPFPVLVVGAAGLGMLLARLNPGLLGLTATGAEKPAAPIPRGAWTRAGRVALACLLLWWAPVALAFLLLGGGHIVVELGLFFSQLAVLTFGGAYAVLAWLAQEGVARGWVTAREMVDGLGLAEPTPGPTILVNQFIGFLAAARDSGALAPVLSATLGALMVTWVTFAPSFLWIFAGAPFVETLLRNPRLAGALAAITAAVVGVIAAIALTFGLAVLFREVGRWSWGGLALPMVTLSSVDGAAAALSAAAFLLLFVLKRDVITSVALLAAAGAVLTRASA